MNLFRRINEGEFIKQTATLLSGAVVAQLIFILFSPLLSRLYSPHEFGMYALFMSILNPLSIIATGRYEQAIVLPESDKDAISIYSITNLISVIISSLLIIILIFFGDKLVHLLKAEQLGNWLYMIPVSLILLTFSQSSTFWFIRKKTFKASAVNKISQSSFNIMCSVPMGFLHVNKGLIIGDVAGKFVLALVSVYQSVKSGLNFRLLKLQCIIDNLIRFRKFPLYNAIPSLLVTLSLSIPIFYINSYFSGSDTGFVNQTRLALFVPLSLISAAISQVLLNRFSEKRKAGSSITREFKKILGYIITVGVLVLLAILAGGRTLFSLVFGNEWAIAGEYAKILVFSYIIQFIVSPFSVVFIAFERIKLLSIWQIFYFLSILLLFLARSVSITDFLLIYTGIEFLCYLIYLFLIMKVIADYERTR